MNPIKQDPTEDESIKVVSESNPTLVLIVCTTLVSPPSKRVGDQSIEKQYFT